MAATGRDLSRRLTAVCCPTSRNPPANETRGDLGTPRTDLTDPGGPSLPGRRLAADARGTRTRVIQDVGVCVASSRIMRAAGSRHEDHGWKCGDRSWSHTRQVICPAGAVCTTYC